MDKLISELLKKNNIKNISKSELKLQISSHPSYPSLHAITGVLDHFGIENMAFDISQTEEVYKNLPPYFIAHLKNEESEKLVFIEKYENNVKIKFIGDKTKNISKQEFLKEWSGIIVVIDKEELATNNNTVKSQFLNYFTIALLTVIISFIFIKNISFSLFSILHLALSIIGIYISTLLIKHELGITSVVVEKLCTTSEKTSCDAVLNSKGAKLFGLLKLSDVSFVYFTSLALAWFVNSLTNHTNYGLIAILSLSAIPIIAYSVYYQAVVVKKWCPLCLATAGVLACHSLIAYFLNPLFFNLDTKGLLILLTSTLTVITLYNVIKPLISSKLSLTKSKIAYYKFKRKFSLFEALYAKSPILGTSINNCNEIVFGTKNAPIEIIAITNPMCHFCKATHQAIESLLKSKNSNIKITIRFNINTDNKEDISYKISNTLLNIYQKDEVICREAMHQIYTEGVNITKWLTTYKAYANTSNYQILESEKNWCTANSINFTPAVYLNNKEYPKEYELNDLSFFIEDLIEQTEFQKQVMVSSEF